jgi:hypothetical protein
MKVILYLLGIACLIVAAVYVLVPADQLPSFLPGYDAAMTRVRLKHGVLTGAVGVVLILVGWFLGRSRT